MHISELEHLRELPSVKFKEETVEGEIFTIVTYMVADPEIWKQKNGIEARGITFDSSGFCVSRPFVKFFNFGENESTSIANIYDLEVVNIFDKIDGSMVHPVLVGKDRDKVVFKTNKSFFSDVAIRATKLLHSEGFEHIKKFIIKQLQQGVTPIFEFTSPDHKIVLDYGQEDKLTLLAMRHNETGQHCAWDYVESLARRWEIPVVESVGNKFPRGTATWTFEHIVKQLRDARDIEGVVVLLENGKRVKVKCPWYVKMHRVMTDIRHRDVAEMVADGYVDDLIGSILSVEPGFDLTEIRKIEAQVISELNELSIVARQIAAEYNGDKKELFRKFGYSKVFKQACVILAGKEPDFVKLWKKNFLKEYSLKVVYNKNF